jgi:hypothetical protein
MVSWFPIVTIAFAQDSEVPDPQDSQFSRQFLGLRNPVLYLGGHQALLCVCYVAITGPWCRVAAARRHHPPAASARDEAEEDAGTPPQYASRRAGPPHEHAAFRARHVPQAPKDDQREVLARPCSCPPFDHQPCRGDPRHQKEGVPRAGLRSFYLLTLQSEPGIESVAACSGFAWGIETHNESVELPRTCTRD